MTTIKLTTQIKQELNNGADLIVAISGGKDSDAMLILLARAREQFGWPGRFVAMHNHVGRMEWPQSLQHCKDMAASVGAEFVVTERPQGDLIDQIRDRMAKRPDAPPFPSSAARYCTSDQKRAQADKWLRNNITGNAVIALGLRGEESPRRARKPVVEERKRASAPTKGRQIWNWLPIQHHLLDDVWNTLLPDGGVKLLEWHQRHYQETGRVDPAWNYHPAYVFGNERLSCALCVLASRNDLINGAQHNPELFNELVSIEIESGFDFQQGKPLSELLIDDTQPHPELQSSLPGF